MIAIVLVQMIIACATVAWWSVPGDFHKAEIEKWWPIIEQGGIKGE
jgi:hypothetical protein